MKGWWEKYLGIILNVMVLLFALLMAIVPLRYDIIKRKQNGRFEKVTNGGIVFFIFAFFALGFGFCKIIYDNTESDKTSNRLERILIYASSQKSDNKELRRGNEQLQRQLNELKSQSKASTDTLLKSRTRIDPKPRLDLCSFIHGNNLNPLTTPATNNNTKLEVSICNSGNTSAYNLQDGAWIIEYIGNNPEIHRIPNSMFNKSLVIVPNQPEIIMSYILGPRNSLFYFCLEIKYTDSANRKVIPMHRILIHNDLNGRFEELHSDEYDKIEKNLINQKFWKKS